MKRAKSEQLITTDTTSLERIYPDQMQQSNGADEKKTLQLHIERYEYAGRMLSPGIVADVACGSGYGSHLLATQFDQQVAKIIALDKSEEAIAYAKTRYNNPKINFAVSDVMANYVEKPNTIISLETIEHLENPQQFILHWAMQLQPGGRFIASVPVTPSVDANPFHYQDFTAASFKSIFLKIGLQEIDSFIQKQRYNPIHLIFKRKTAGHRSIRRNLIGYYFKNPGKFFLRIRSVLKDGFTNKYLVAVFEKPE
ncbi:MAG TPA: class I SAM-dependent methyltransferase [Chitinophagaceae bacterium]|nr:class I SAM-dependent methyltransferase [Chitinophagaceae bacterium]